MPPSKTVDSPAGHRSKRLRLWLGVIAIVVTTLVAYRPALDGGFIWDDDDYVTNNDLLRTGTGLVQLWEPGHTHQYYPAVFTTFWVENHLWGLNPRGYHVVNVLLHIANALLLWRILSLLGIPGAWMIGAVFALHPMHVESVAWITERKNVLSGLFYLLAMLAYLRFDPMRDEETEAHPPPRAWRPYAASLLFFVLALLSKSVTCSLPLALILVMILRRQRLRPKRLLPLVPMFVIGFAAAMQTTFLERESVGARGAQFDFSFVERSLIACRSLVHYPLKLLVPHPLVFIYPRWTIDAGDWRSWWPVAVVLAVAIASLVAFLRGRRGPAVAVAFFVVTIFPALGFVDYWPMVYSFVADHFSYLASIGLIALVVAPLAHRFGSVRGVQVIAGAVLLVFSGLVWGEGHKYANEEALWRKTIADNPGAWMAYNNLGVVFLRDHGRLGDAAELVRRGDTRGAAQVLETSSTQELLDFARRLPALPPDRAAQAADAMERRRAPMIDEAIREFKASLDVNPDNYQANGNLAVAMHRLGRYEEALTYWQALMAHGTATPDDRYGMGLTLEKLGRTDEAIADYEGILRQAPEHLAAHLRLGQLLAQEGRHDEAEAHFEFLVARYPGSVSLQLYLGERAETRDDWAKAIDHYQTALRYARASSDIVELTRRLATIRAMCPDRRFRDASVAIRLVEPLLQTSEQRDPAVLHIHAAALADMGRFDEAVREAGEALTLARAKGMTDLVAKLEPRLQAYRAGRADPADGGR